MTQKWNLQDIRPAESKKRSRVEVQETTPRATEEKPQSTKSFMKRAGTTPNKKKYLILSGIIALLILAIFGLSAVLSKTTLTVFPEFREVVVNAELTAYPERREGSLSYETLTLEATKERQMTATGEEYVETQAMGSLNIMKTTPGSERLIKNTRFRSADGLVFRIQESVVVPGATTDEDGTTVPGMIAAEVFADTAGQEYNLAANTRFDVPGFQESNLSSLYNSIYAVNPEPMTGGYKGQKFLINDTELSTARQELQLEMRNELLARLETEKPAGFISFPDSVALTFQALPTVSSGENQVTIREQAVLQMPIFAQEEFARYLASETIPTYNQEPVRITGEDTLEFSYVDLATNTANISSQTSLVFKISGKPTIVWEFDAEQLQKDLAGKPKTSISTVLTAHPGIKSAKVSSKPFWRRTFPTEPEKIEIVEVIGEEQ